MGHRCFEIPLFLFALLVIFSTDVYAISGDQFLAKCNTATEASPKGESPQEVVNRALDAGSCAGFVGGVIKGMNLVGNMLIEQKAMNRNFVCLPHGVAANTLLDEVVTYLRKHPKEMGAPAQMHIFNLFIEKYPCRASAPR